MKPHKHAETIKAWADGAVIEYRIFNAQPWEQIVNPSWDNDTEYRIKPEPKPDVFCLYSARDYSGGEFYGPKVEWIGSYKASNLKLWFDGETGALKSAEVLK
jgi:hypothetical protein